MKTWEKILSEACSFAFAPKYRALIDALAADIREYVRHFEEIDQIPPEQRIVLANLWLELGSHIGYNDYALAYACYQRCVTVDPKNAQGWYWGANALSSAIGKEDLDEALFCIDTYLKTVPSDASGWMIRGGIFASMNRHAAAVCVYDKAIALDRKFVLAYYNKVLSLKAMDENEAVLKTINHLFYLDDAGTLSLDKETRAFLHFYKAGALEAVGETAASLIYFDDYITYLKGTDSYDVEAHIQKGEALSTLGQAAEGEKIFLQALENAYKKAEVANDSAPAWTDLAKCFSRFSLHEEACRSLIFSEIVDEASEEARRYFEVIKKDLDAKTIAMIRSQVRSQPPKAVEAYLLSKAKAILDAGAMALTAPVS